MVILTAIVKQSNSMMFAYADDAAVTMMTAIASTFKILVLMMVTLITVDL